MSSDFQEVNLNRKFEELRERLDALIGRKEELGAKRAMLAEDQTSADAQAAAIAEQKRMSDERLLRLAERTQQLTEADAELTEELEDLQQDLVSHADVVREDRAEEDKDIRTLTQDVARRLPPPEKPAKSAKRKK